MKLLLLTIVSFLFLTHSKEITYSDLIDDEDIKYIDQNDDDMDQIDNEDMKYIDEIDDDIDDDIDEIDEFSTIYKKTSNYLCPEGNMVQNKCECDSADPEECQNDKSACAILNNCSENGKCVDVEGNIECECYKGFTGPSCQEIMPEVPVCHQNSCPKGTKCMIIEEKLVCACPMGKMDPPKCKKAVCPFLKNPCKNGKCRPAINDYKCECKPGYTGRNCEIADCSFMKCKAGKECMIKKNKPSCVSNKVKFNNNQGKKRKKIE